MHTKQQIKNFLEHQAYKLRVLSLEMTTQAKSGHPTSCLSSADLVSALFFYAMSYDPRNAACPENDRFILSKGHASPVLYAAWHLAGVVSYDELMTYRKIDSVIEGHPTLRFSHSEAATGSLGMGLSIGLGMARYATIFEKGYKTYVLMGDSEIAEGSVWEAAEIAAYYKQSNLVALVDCNRLGQSTSVLYDHHVNRYADRFASCGWKTIVIDGHDMTQIMSALDKANEISDRPVVIIAKTFKGYGLASVENKEGYHGKAFSKEELPGLLTELKNRFAYEASHAADAFDWKPHIPVHDEQTEEHGIVGIEIPEHLYKLGESVATRKAYGQALVAAGTKTKKIVVLDAEVKNSTYAELFEKKFPKRFVQCFIAEQNMVSMGVGMERRGAVPFISTFGAFFSRAADQVRMAAIGSSALRLCGSHAGVSIGQDGPSQMALEDIALMRAIPGSAVLYPSDAVSAHHLVGQMLEYNQGISYLRTTRAETPVLYSLYEEFHIGGCKVLRKSDKDKLLVIGAGITLHEALKAHKLLADEGVDIAVIDLYSVKPLDHETIIKVAKDSGNTIITVEDHYSAGGIGESVASAVINHGISVHMLAVTQLPRSGAPEELLSWARIDASAIITLSKSIVKKGLQKSEKL